MKKLRKGNGISLINVTLIILVTILLVFLAYTIISGGVVVNEEGNTIGVLNVIVDWTKYVTRRGKC